MNRNGPTYMVVLRAEPDIDPVRALRRGLKFLLRACGLRAIDLRGRFVSPPKKGDAK